MASYQRGANILRCPSLTPRGKTVSVNFKSMQSSPSDRPCDGNPSGMKTPQNTAGQRKNNDGEMSKSPWIHPPQNMSPNIPPIHNEGTAPLSEAKHDNRRQSNAVSPDDASDKDASDKSKKTSPPATVTTDSDTVPGSNGFMKMASPMEIDSETFRDQGVPKCNASPCQPSSQPSSISATPTVGKKYRPHLLHSNKENIPPNDESVRQYQDEEIYRRKQEQQREMKRRELEAQEKRQREREEKFHQYRPFSKEGIAFQCRNLIRSDFEDNQKFKDSVMQTLEPLLGKFKASAVAKEASECELAVADIAARYVEQNAVFQPMRRKRRKIGDVREGPVKKGTPRPKPKPKLKPKLKKPKLKPKPRQKRQKPSKQSMKAKSRKTTDVDDIDIDIDDIDIDIDDIDIDLSSSDDEELPENHREIICEFRELMDTVFMENIERLNRAEAAKAKAKKTKT